MILCYLLGGLLLSEITRSYLVLILAAGTFGLLSHRLLELLPPHQLGPGRQLPGDPAAGGDVRGADAHRQRRRLATSSRSRSSPRGAWPPGPCWAILVNRRLLHPPDVGSEGKDVVDEEEEMKYAIGVVIDRDLFPDKLFAPAKRTDLMPDGTNPVLDKELRSEIFSQGTLMLRVVIQVSMLLSIPLMAALLVPPLGQGGLLRRLRADLQSAGRARCSRPGSITQERERQTLSLLLTTLLRPGQDRHRQAAGGAAGLDGPDLPADRAAPAGLRPAPRAARSLLDAGRLLADHRHDLPGDVDDRTHVLGAGAADRRRRWS